MTLAADIADRLPTLDEYLALCEGVGWSKYVNRETARVALSNSLCAVVAEQDSRCVGMGRIVGDGALFFYIQDVVVEPSLQGQGLGQKLMIRLMQWLDDNAPDRAFVGLFSAKGKTPFYERYGFSAAAIEGPGMYQYLRMPK